MEDEISLSQLYKYVYICETPGCANAYGSDKEENDKHICPVCLDKIEKGV